MTVRADWFQSPATPSDDPFAGMLSTTPVITIESSEDEMMARLRTLIQREARLDEAGVTCPLKDHAEATCSACPVSCIGNSDSPLSALCRVGQEQEQVLTTLHAKRYGI